MSNADRAELVRTMTAQGWIGAAEFVEGCSDEELADVVAALAEVAS